MKMGYFMAAGAAFFFLMSGFILKKYSDAPKKKTIAVLMSNAIYFHEKVLEGVHGAANLCYHRQKINVVAYPFSGTDKIHAAAVCEAILEIKPDVIVSIGAVGTRILHETMRRRNHYPPVIYVGLHNGVELGLIESAERPGTNMTGVMNEGFDSLIPAQLLLVAKPDVKKVLIPYDITSDFHGLARSSAEAAEKYLKSKGVKVDVVPIDGVNNAQQIVKTFLPGYDVLMGLEAGTLVQFNASFAKMCSQQGVTFFCGTIEGVVCGAAITYAIVPNEMGIKAVEQAIEILFNGKQPATMPVVSIQSKCELYINPVAGGEQDFVPNVEQIRATIAGNKDLCFLKGKVNVITPLPAKA